MTSGGSSSGGLPAPRLRWSLIAACLALLCVFVSASGSGSENAWASGGTAVALDVPIGAATHVAVEPNPTGGFRYVLTDASGRLRRLTPAEFAERYYREQTTQPWWMRILNVQSTAGVLWVAFGLLGQLLFTGRMLLQWIASERLEESVVPVAFWWLSLGGASMLLSYFLWRRDIVGVLGQSAGWMIYCRNLVLIHRNRTTRGPAR